MHMDGSVDSGFWVAKPCALCAVIEVFPIAASSMWVSNCNRQNISTHSVRQSLSRTPGGRTPSPRHLTSELEHSVTYPITPRPQRHAEAVNFAKSNAADAAGPHSL